MYQSWWNRLIPWLSLIHIFTATVIARDGIAVIVNKDNDVDELTSDQVKAVYTGETTTWEDLAK